MLYKIGDIVKIYYDADSKLWDDLYKHLFDNCEKLPDLCCECKFAHDLNVKLYSCDDDMEDIVYCDKHECICKAERPACDWAAVSVE